MVADPHAPIGAMKDIHLDYTGGFLLSLNEYLMRWIPPDASGPLAFVA